MSKPLITALIDTYNHERYIEQAVLSVLQQDFSPADLEVLVIDDGSSDKTPEILRKFGSRIRYLRKENGGQASAFNAAIPEAHGEVVAFLDGDDWWAKAKLSAVLEAFEDDPLLGVVGHGYYEVTTDGLIRESVLPEKAFRIELGDAEGVRLFDALQTFLGTSRLAVRASLLQDVLPVPNELVFSADRFIYTLAVSVARAVLLDKPLCYYRVHDENLFRTEDSARLRRSQEMQSLVTEKLYPQLCAREIRHDIVDALLEPHRLLAKRVRLSCDGGMPWETFQVEREAYRRSHTDGGLADSAFRALVLGLTLLMPPKRFYGLKRWYWDKRVGRYRGKSYPGTDARIRRQSVST